ncbi:cupin domain-containing protein [Alteribacter natronophilus]|uniref:cupin domain-containing protein n=1 Tax=Alteribacter natronophilus TaxID=2583810 RepID=UPI00110EF801|nr:cupin domain-containing protein [Alteribacter natronophilus]TMW72476.1 cupin domain-containing protein [Alteribacter natronophilus]
MQIQKNANRSITHVYTGEVITFLERPEETDDSSLLIEVTLPPGGKGPDLHYHLRFEEEFENIEGSLFVQLNKEEHILGIGERVIVPKKAHHMFKNASESEPVTFRVRLSPGHHFEDSMRILYGLMEDGLILKAGKFKSLYHGAVILDMQDTKLAAMPVFLQKGMFGLLAKRARKKGIDEELKKKYCIREDGE